MRRYYVYIVASHSRRIYTGVTSAIMKRLWQHRNGLCPGFTRRYHVHRLVHLETYSAPQIAIAREKEIKAWRRERKIRLIEADNPGWLDLSAGWFGESGDGEAGSVRGDSGS